MFIAFVMRVGGDIDTINTYPTEAQADEFGKEESAYGELDPVMDDPDHWKNYDPPVVVIFEADDGLKAMENGKYKRPVAIFQRGEKYVCGKAS